MEITEYDLEQGKIIYNVLCSNQPDTVKRLRDMLTTVGYDTTLFFMNKNTFSDMPQGPRELFITAIKYIYHTIQSTTNKN